MMQSKVSPLPPGIVFAIRSVSRRQRVKPGLSGEGQLVVSPDMLSCATVLIHRPLGGLGPNAIHPVPPQKYCSGELPACVERVRTKPSGPIWYISPPSPRDGVKVVGPPPAHAGYRSKDQSRITDCPLADSTASRI